MPFTIAWQSSKVPSIATRVDVVVADRRHHAPLHVGDAAVAGTERSDVGAGAAAKRLDRRTAGIAGGRDHDACVRSPRAASAWSISRARSCIARSLKASVGPWNRSSTKVAHAELHDRRDGGMAERCRRPRAPCGRGSPARDPIADETPESPRRRLPHKACRLKPGIAAARAAASLRHVEAAVAGEACEHRLDEAERRCLALVEIWRTSSSCGRRRPRGRRCDARLRY